MVHAPFPGIPLIPGDSGDEFPTCDSAVEIPQKVCSETPLVALGGPFGPPCPTKLYKQAPDGRTLDEK